MSARTRAARPGSPLLVRQRYACAYEEGPRPLPEPSAALRHGAPVLRHVSTLVCAVTPEPVLALTYDDGPDPETTPAVLDALGRHGVRATFFVLAGRALAHPRVVGRIVADGHELGLHGRDHRRLSALPLAEAIREVRRGRAELEQLAGRRVRWFRPAYGAQTIPLRLAVRALGLEPVLWSAWARDWTDEPTDVVLERAIGAVHPGGIMLLHDAAAGVGSGPAPVFDRGGLTEGLLRALSTRGYRAGTVSELVASATPARTPWWETRAQGRERAAASAAAPV